MPPDGPPLFFFNDEAATVESLRRHSPRDAEAYSAFRELDAVEEGILAGAAAGPVPVMVTSTLPELLDDTAAWRFACAGVPCIAGLRTGVAVAAALPAPLPRSRAAALDRRGGRSPARPGAGLRSTRRRRCSVRAACPSFADFSQ